jgi:pSer/pThr/pTyr-binding forkhead associated (FHA) protein
MASSSHVHVLKLLNGDDEGREYPLDAGGSYIAGRSAAANFVIPDDTVSRKHVRFYHARGSVWMRDLGSRNGTLVNGIALDRHRLREGDRLGIGATLLRVDLIPASRVSRRPRAEDSSGRSMSGSVQDIPLPDVLQWLATSRKTGTLKVHGPVDGALYLREGNVFHATIGGSDQLDPQKALIRMLGWSDGMFELDTAVPEDLPAEGITQSLGQLLMEAARQQDELAHLASKHPLPDDRISLVLPSEKAWRELEGDALDMLQAVAEGRAWPDILDASKVDDLTLTQQAVALAKAGYVRFE